MNITGICPYETPCGWCTKWDKKCDEKIGCDKPPRGLRAATSVYDDAMNPSVTYEPCAYCESYEYGDPKCPTCRKENYKFFEAIKE